MKVIHLPIGWHSANFEREIQRILDAYEIQGYKYHDIKISSSSENLLLILKEHVFITAYKKTKTTKRKGKLFDTNGKEY